MEITDKELKEIDLNVKDTKDENVDTYKTSQARKLKKMFYASKNRRKKKRYVQRAYPLFRMFSFLKGYHYLSILLAIATAALFSFKGITLQDHWSTYVGRGVICLLCGVLAWAVEEGKKYFLGLKFEEGAKEGYINLSLLGLVLISIVISALGGFMSVEFVTNKTTQLNTEKNIKITSIENQYRPRLQHLDKIISGLEDMSIDSKKRKWGLTKEEQANLVASKNEKNDILKEQESRKASIKTLYNGKVNNTNKNSLMFSLVTAGFVFVFEILLIFSYKFCFLYDQKVQEEGSDIGVFDSDENINNTSGGQAPPLPYFNQIQAAQDAVVQDQITQAINNIIPQAIGNVSNENNTDKTVLSKAAPISMVPSNFNKSVTPDMSSNNQDNIPTATEQQVNKHKNNTAKTASSGKRENSYQIEDICYNIAYAKLEEVKKTKKHPVKNDEPFYTVWRYHMLLPDLQNNMSYGNMNKKTYPIINAKTGVLDTKKVSTSTIRNTVIPKLRELGES